MLSKNLVRTPHFMNGALCLSMSFFAMSCATSPTGAYNNLMKEKRAYHDSLTLSQKVNPNADAPAVNDYKTMDLSDDDYVVLLPEKAGNASYAKVIDFQATAPNMWIQVLSFASKPFGFTPVRVIVPRVELFSKKQKTPLPLVARPITQRGVGWVRPAGALFSFEARALVTGDTYRIVITSDNLHAGEKAGNIPNYAAAGIGGAAGLGVMLIGYDTYYSPIGKFELEILDKEPKK